MRGFFHDLRFGLRLVRQQPLMAAAGMLSLAVGLGLNFLLFTLANGILFRPLPVAGADRLVMIQTKHQFGTRMDFSYPIYVQLKEASSGVLDTMVAYSSAEVTGRAGDRAAESLEGEYVTGNFFADLAVPIGEGRGLTVADDRPEAPPALVVSRKFWREHFGRDRLAAQTILVNETPFTIVGVAHESFFGTEIGRVVDFWMPIGQMFNSEKEDYRNRPTISWLALMGRLKPGITRDAAAARLTAASSAFFKTSGYDGETLVLADGRQGDSDLPRRLEEPLRLLMGASLCVLLIACVNVANLQLARAAARRQELSLRSALGAARSRLVSLLVADALILTVPAALVGLGVAVLWRGGAASLIARYGEPVLLDAPMDMRVIGAAVLMTVAAAVIVGGVSAWLSTRRAPSLALAHAGRGSIGGAPKTQRALVVVQFALSMTLVAGAALLVRTVDQLRGSDLGFNRDIALVGVAPGQAGYDRPALPRYYSSAFERLRQVPGVKDVAMAHVMPLDFGGARQSIDIQGYTPAENEDMEFNNIRVSPGYFTVLGIQIVAGREFDERDAADRITRVIVNETLAKRYWPNGQAIGRFIRLGPRGPHAVEVIGIAKDVRYRNVREKVMPTFYVSTSQAPVGFFTLHVRTSGNPEARIGEIERAVASVDPRVPVARAYTLNGQLDRNISEERMARSIAVVLGIAALVLAATGLFATMAFAVRRRTREIGVRMALGANVSNVRAMILKQGLVLVAAGSVFGIAGAYWAGRAIQSQLYGVTPADTISYAGAAIVLAAAALVATWLPARRAMRVDPISALRES